MRKNVVGIAEATTHKQWGKTKAQEPNQKHRTKDNQNLFTQQLISQKSIPFTCVDPSPFIGRWTDFLHPEDTLVRKVSKQNVLGYFWKVSD
jgi:hypothetical protein